MKINRNNQGNNKKISFKENLLIDVYYFLKMYRYLFFIVIGLIIVGIIAVFTINLIAPKELKYLDEKATISIFHRLQKANRHHDAIMIMEHKGDLLSSSDNRVVYKVQLSDSYKQVGDFSKAEKILLSGIEDIKVLAKLDKMGINNDTLNLIMGAYTRIIYQLYEEIEDVKNQEKYYHIYKDYYEKLNSKGIDINKFISSLYTHDNKKSPDITLSELLEYDSISVVGLQDKKKGMALMDNYVKKIIDNESYGHVYKVKCLNKAIKWSLELGNLAQAYEWIYLATYQVSMMRQTREYEGLGELSDYLYQVHDIPMSKALYKRYKKYVKENFSKTDYGYLENQIRSFRYLEKDSNWEDLTNKIVSYCSGMRKQIAQNLPSMSNEQQEFYCKKFDLGYNYALKILQEHPSEKLADLCFDNITFRSGLLLRSNLAIKGNMQPEDTTLYNTLQEKRMELIQQSLIHFYSTKALESDIDNLEKELAMRCTDYKTKNDIEEMNYTKIQKKLKSDEAIVTLIEHQGSLFSLTLKNNGHVFYDYIGKITDIQQILQEPISKIYDSPNLTHYLWDKTSTHLDTRHESRLKETQQKFQNIDGGCKTVYYLPIGIFNQISLGALSDSEGTFLCDTKDFKLISNPSDILDGKTEPLLLAKGNHDIVLWGGIDYGFDTSVSTPSNKRTAINRGDFLYKLSYTRQEVMDINQMLKKNGYLSKLYMEKEATKESFIERSGKEDYIIHVSTHGFFNDNVSQTNSMLESGLFFAGANLYWQNDSINYIYGEDDGILRSAEISILDLSKCSLAVLSACETGLGYSNSCEGIYGLQRALKLAGVHWILMSLWNVDDQATTYLMTEFYKNLIDGMDADKALKESQRIVRNTYPSPEDWGGFVLLH